MPPRALSSAGWALPGPGAAMPAGAPAELLAGGPGAHRWDAVLQTAAADRAAASHAAGYAQPPYLAAALQPRSSAMEPRQQALQAELGAAPLEHARQPPPPPPLLAAQPTPPLMPAAQPCFASAMLLQAPHPAPPHMLVLAEQPAFPHASMLPVAQPTWPHAVPGQAGKPPTPVPVPRPLSGLSDVPAALALASMAPFPDDG